MFYSRTHLPDFSPSPSGDRVVSEYGWKVNPKTSEKYIGVVGETDLYTPIQEALSSTYLRDVLDRFDAGAVSLADYKEYIEASKTVAPYTDATAMPTTLAGVQQVLIDSENTFRSLPVDLRADFNHSKEQFLSAVADGSASKIFQAYSERKGLVKKDQDEKKEVKKDES